MYRKFIKRVMDIFVSLVVLIVSSPILLFVVIVLFIINKGKPFFIQRRPGLNEKIFSIIKFKTMTDEKDSEGNLLPDAMRMTKFGNFIRKSSIDELPQLFNVLIGDMSLIGPRPLLEDYLPLYNEAQSKRHNVKPGITGWAQINGRNAISWVDKFNLDLWYVNNISFKTDIIIITKTVIKVFKREGISSNSCATMEMFKGN